MSIFDQRRARSPRLGRCTRLTPDDADVDDAGAGAEAEARRAGAPVLAIGIEAMADADVVLSSRGGALVVGRANAGGTELWRLQDKKHTGGVKEREGRGGEGRRDGKPRRSYNGPFEAN